MSLRSPRCGAVARGGGRQRCANREGRGGSPVCPSRAGFTVGDRTPQRHVGFASWCRAVVWPAWRYGLSSCVLRRSPRGGAVARGGGRQRRGIGARQGSSPFRCVRVRVCVCVCVRAGLAAVVRPQRVTLVCCVSRRVQYDTTALLEACFDGHLAVVQWLVTEAGSDAASERDNVSCAAYCRCRVSLARRRSPPVARRDACPRRRQFSNRLRSELPRLLRCVVAWPGHTLHRPSDGVRLRPPRRGDVARDERAQRRGIGARQGQSAAVLAACHCACDGVVV